MTRKGESVTLSLSDMDKEQLEQIALQFGCTWGEKPNVSALMKAIAQRRIILYWSDELPKTEIRKNLAKAAIAKIQQGLSELGDAL